MSQHFEISVPVQYSRCDDGLVIIHTEGDIVAFVDGSICPPEDEAIARSIVTAINCHSTLLECLKDARRLLTDQDAIDLAHIDEVIAKAEGSVA